MASWNKLGNAHYHLGDYPQALEAHQRSLVLKETLGDQAGCAVSLNNIGSVYKASTDLERALSGYQQSRLITQDLGNTDHQAGALGKLPRRADRTTVRRGAPAAWTPADQR